MSRVESKRVDDGFMRKVIYLLVATVIAQGGAFLVGVGAYAKQVDLNTERLDMLGSVDSIAAAVSERLTANYMTAEKVDITIRKAESRFIAIQEKSIIPLTKSIEEIRGDLKYLIKREIEKGDR